MTDRVHREPGGAVRRAIHPCTRPPAGRSRVRRAPSPWCSWPPVPTRLARLSGGQVSEAARAVAPSIARDGAHLRDERRLGRRIFNPVVSLRVRRQADLPAGLGAGVLDRARSRGAILAALVTAWPVRRRSRGWRSAARMCPTRSRWSSRPGLTWLLLMVILGTADRSPCRSRGELRDGLSRATPSAVRGSAVTVHQDPGVEHRLHAHQPREGRLGPAVLIRP